MFLFLLLTKIVYFVLTAFPFFHLVQHACGCLLHLQLVEEEDISAHLQKMTPQPGHTIPLEPCAFASYDPETSKQTSVIL